MYLVVKNNVVFSFFIRKLLTNLFSFKKHEISLNICYANYNSVILISKEDLSVRLFLKQ